MTRDRLPALKAAHEALLIEGEDNLEDQTSVHEVSITFNNEGDIFMETFFKEVEDIRDKLEIIEDKLEQSSRKQKDIIANAALEDDAQKLKNELEEITSDIKSLVNGVRSSLNIMEHNIRRDEESKNTAAAFRIRKIQYSTLIHKFMELMAVYNKNQEEHQGKCKEEIRRQLEVVGQDYTGEQIDEMLKEGTVEIFTQNINTETRQAKEILRNIESRRDDLLKLEQSLRELHELFQELGNLVEEQGHMVDRIENEVTKTKDFVVDAKGKIDSAITLQKSARKKKFIIIGIILVVLLVIILIIVFSVK